MKPVVLIVDDSLTVRMDLGEHFESAGHATVLCGTLAEARAALARTSFALLVLDVLLPDGDGIDLLHEIRTAPATAQLPVMLLSTEAEVASRIRGLQTGADEYVGKPYDPAYVVARARELVGRGAPGPALPARPNVLVIDDSATFREELKSALEGAGYAVATAETGEDGLRAALDLRPDAVVVDGVLPGIDGPTVVRRMKQDAALRRTPCLLLTASDGGGGELSALDAGADAYLRKGTDLGILLARLAALLRASSAPAARDAASSYLGPKRILAVDDSATYLHELADQLRAEGYDVVPAHSGEEALQLLDVQPADCILLDLVMPGLSGHETCRRIKGTPRWRDIPLLMLTALDEREAMIEGIESGADDYITKSADFDVLRARLRAQLRRKQFEDENRRFREDLMVKEREAAEARAARELAETRAVLLAELKFKNSELEAFCYTVSHDLQGPLRAIEGFSAALLEDYAGQLDAAGQGYLKRVRAATHRMAELIRDLLELSRISRADLRWADVDLSALVREIAQGLQAAEPARKVDFAIAPAAVVRGDAGLLRVALENLFDNAWKFTSRHPSARIEFGIVEAEGKREFFVRDDGAGFDPVYAHKLFTPFQRLHTHEEFPGTGVGLATVQRILQRHGGQIRAIAGIERGAEFRFTL